MTATETTSTGLMLGRPTFCTQIYSRLHDKPAEGFVADTTSRTGAHFFLVNNVPNANKRRVTSLNVSYDGGLWQTRLLLWILSTVLFQNTYRILCMPHSSGTNVITDSNPQTDSSTRPQFLQNIGYMFLVHHPC
jgi:hypothetical protein